MAVGLLSVEPPTSKSFKQPRSSASLQGSAALVATRGVSLVIIYELLLDRIEGDPVAQLTAAKQAR